MTDGAQPLPSPHPSKVGQNQIDPSRIEAAVFDYGGVLIEGGPGEVRAFGRKVGLNDDVWRALRLEIFGNDGIWSVLERGETTFAAFLEELQNKVRRAGGTIDEATAVRFMGDPDPMAQSKRLRPQVLEAVAAIRKRMPTALLTNNVREWRDGWSTLVPVDDLFDVIIDSSAVGARKPETRIYEITAERLGMDHDRLFFLDDIGQNLKAARALGWQTLLYTDTDSVLQVLATIAASPSPDARPAARPSADAVGKAQ